jgi:hypothetical protein
MEVLRLVPLSLQERLRLMPLTLHDETLLPEEKLLLVHCHLPDLEAEQRGG